MSNSAASRSRFADEISGRTVHTSVLIVGGGMSGVCMGVFLKKRGIEDFLIIEKDQEFGGTWNANRYPGCECDVPAVYYSYSFAPNAEWSRKWVGWQELLEYVKGVADSYALRQKTVFGVEAQMSVWDESESVYRLTCNDGKVKIVARFIVSAQGGLSRPFTPELPGRDSFRGASMHTAKWDEKVQLEGKKVAVIGSAASAIQLIPQIADKVEKLYVLQRTPNYISPHTVKDNRPYGPIQRFLFRHGFLKLFRYYTYLDLELYYLLTFSNFVTSRLVEKTFLGYMRKVIKSPELQAKLTPDYRIGCKRILLSDNFYPTLNKPNVELVTDPIQSLYEGGIIVKPKTPEAEARALACDVVIYATGFDLGAVFKRQNVYGRGGKRLFFDDQDTYLGITVPHFPNLFSLLGPNTGLGSSSIIFMIECQAEYAAQCIEEVLKKHSPRATIEVKEKVCRDFCKMQQAALAGTKWASGCKSWYQDENGRINTLWHTTTWKYWWKTRRVEFKRDFIIDEGNSPRTARREQKQGHETPEKMPLL